MQFLLIHQYAGNKGDRAVLAAMIAMLQSQFEGCNIVVSTSDPELWSNEFIGQKVSFVPWAWDYNRASGIWWSVLRKFQKYTFTILRETFLKNISVTRLLSNPQFHNALKSSDIVLSVGGHHFTTILSRDLVCSINFDAAIAVSCKPVVCFSQSFGPFEFHNGRNHLFTQRILSACAMLMPREDKASTELHQLCPDLCNIAPTNESVITLGSMVPKFTPAHLRPKKVGIAIYCAQKRTPEAREHYINTIACACDHIISRDYSIQFFPMEIQGTPPDDRFMIKEIIDKVNCKQHVSLIENDMPTAEHLKAVADCSVFIGHKTHSTIFAMATGTPLIGIAYHPKTIEFMRQFGVERYAIDDSMLDSTRLIQSFDAITSELESVSNTLHEKAGELSRKIQNDFTDVINKVLCKK